MVSKSCLEIFVCWLAHCKAFCKSFSEMEGYIETTSKERNLSLSLFGSSLNQDMTESEFIHCLYLVLVLTSLIILERICLEMTCRSGEPNFGILLEMWFVIFQGDPGWPSLSGHNPVIKIMLSHNLLLMFSCSPEIFFSCLFVFFVDVLTKEVFELICVELVMVRCFVSFNSLNSS